MCDEDKTSRHKHHAALKLKLAATVLRNLSEHTEILAGYGTPLENAGVTFGVPALVPLHIAACYFHPYLPLQRKRWKNKQKLKMKVRGGKCRYKKGLVEVTLTDLDFYFALDLDLVWFRFQKNLDRK
jgi:hypothetical protein